MHRAGRTSAGILGAAATLLLHSLLFMAALWDGGAVHEARLPEATGAGANLGRPDGESRDRLILIQLQPDTVREVPNTTVPVLLQKVSEPSMLAITGPDQLPLAPLLASEQGDTEVAEADRVARTRLMGLYEGQIRARIERAWLRPRDSIEEDRFRCRAMIRQDAAGAIREVELQQCNGSVHWQRSLVDAIFSASPLPAPPDPHVFVDAFSMQFEAVAYRQGMPDSLYESVAMATSP